MTCKFLKALPAFLFAVVLAAQQPATERRPNDEYRTPEGRAAIAKILDNPERAARLKPRELLALIQIKPGEKVADIGAGTGLFEPYLAEAVGAQGLVYAEDIFPDFLERVRNKLDAGDINNVTPVLGSEKNPRLPRNELQKIVVIDVYHHFDYPKAMLAGFREALRPDGRLAIVDYFKRASPNPGHIQKEREEVIAEIEGQNFKLERMPHLTEDHYVLVFRKE